MAEGLPLLDSVSPDTLERIVDGVLQLESGQRSLMELEDDIFGFCVKAFQPTSEGEIRLDIGDRVKLQSCEARGGQGVYHVVNLRTGLEGTCPVDTLDFCDGTEDVTTDSNGPSPLPLIDGMSGHAHQRQGDPSATPTPNGGESGGHDNSDSPLRAGEGEEAGLGPHRSRGVTLVRRPHFKTKSKASVDTSTVQATVGEHGKDHGNVSLSIDCDLYKPEDVRRQTSAYSSASRQTSGVSRPRGLMVESDEEVLDPEMKYVADMGIFSLGGFDKESRPVIVFAACKMPESYRISHDRLFEYALTVLDKYVENDYTIVYFHHGLTKASRPDMRYVRQAYTELNKKYKKNLKKVYIVHPSSFIKLVLILMKPFLSVKFGRKIVYVNRLADLGETLYLDQISIPEVVKRYDASLDSHSSSSGQPVSSVFHKPTPTDEEIEGVLAKRQFGTTLESIHKNLGEGGEDLIPPVVRECVTYLEEHGLRVLGIFRRSAALGQIMEIKKSVNRGTPLCLATYNEPHIAAVLLKMFLRDLQEPLLTFPAHPEILGMSDLSAEEYLRRAQQLVQGLPELNYQVLKYIMQLMIKIVECTEDNKMSTSNLAIVLGPNMVWSKSEVATLSNIGAINNFVVVLIGQYQSIFIR